MHPMWTLAHWLTVVLPREMRAAWRLVRADLPLWLSVSVVLATLAARGSRPEADPRILVPLSTVVILVVLTTMAVRFEAAAGGSSSHSVLEKLLARSILLLVNLLTAVTVCAVAGVAVRAAILLVASDFTTALTLARLAGVLVYWALLVRYCFVPFTTVLDERPAAPVSRWTRPLEAVLWPLVVSSRWTEGRRLRLAPYVAVVAVGTGIISPLPPAWRLPALAVWQLFTLTVQAALFNAYREAKAAA